MKQILHIAYHPELRRNAADLLGLMGFEVLSAENGPKGIALAKEKIPDLILCDANMPALDGYEVLTELKKDQTASKIPFVLVVVAGAKSEEQKGLELGANACIRKPFEVKELFDTVQQLLKKK